MVSALFKKSSGSESKHIKRKVLLLGDGAVGKTSLIRKFVMDKFDDKYIATIGTKVTKKELEIHDDGEKIYLTLMIWDVLGQKGFRGIQSASFKGADGVIFVCDYTRKETFDSLIEYWLPILGDKRSKMKKIFVANKCDLISDAKFSLTELTDLASKHDTNAYSSSAKTGDHVEELFLSLGKTLIGIKKDETEEPEVEPVTFEEVPDDIDIVAATDQVVSDFCSAYGDMELAMPVIRQQFSKAGVDIRNPTKQGLLKVIDMLADVERDFRDERTVRENRTKRRLWVRKVNN
jgi:small GTP-binding protein